MYAEVIQRDGVLPLLFEAPNEALVADGGVAVREVRLPRREEVEL